MRVCGRRTTTRTAAVCGPRSVPDTVRVRFSEAGEAPRPAGRARVSRTRATPRSRRTLSADPAALSRGGRTGTCRFTAREPVTVCRHNLGGRPGALERRSSRQSRAAGAGARARSPPPSSSSSETGRDGRAGARAPACRRRVGLAEYPVYDPQTGVARDPRVTEAAMCVRLVDVRITCGLHDDAQIAAVFIDPRAK